VLDLRLYRASLVPFVIAALIAAFTLTALPSPLSSTLPPAAFNATRVSATLKYLARHYPDRGPGSPGDDALAAYVAHRLHVDGFTVTTSHTSAGTVRGTRRLTTVIATRPGSGGAIVLVAHRDATHAGSTAQLSATATLLELATDLSERTGQRPLTFVSTSGGSGANAGAAIAAANIPRPVDGVIVIGDVAGTTARRPFVIPLSGEGSVASLLLTQTLGHDIYQQLNMNPGGFSVLGQLARFALPLDTTEQAPFNNAGLPAVLIQHSGELGPTPTDPVSGTLLAGFGRAILAAVNALEGGPQTPTATTRDLTVGANVLGGWAIRLLTGLLILSSLGCTLDVVARCRRRRIPIARWLRWVAGWAVPFLAAGLFAKLLALSGLLKTVPPAPVTPTQLALASSGKAALVSVLVVFALACLLRTAVKRKKRSGDPDEVAGMPAAVLTLSGLLAAILWLANPYTAGLVAIPLALWVIVMTRAGRRPILLGALVLLLSLAPFLVLLAIEAQALSLSPLGFAWTWLLVFAGGEISLGALLACSLAGAVTLCAALILLRPGAPGIDDPREITVRGPASYAGPGSLGGTDSALRH
jgi:hypothetical protein